MASNLSFCAFPSIRFPSPPFPCGRKATPPNNNSRKRGALKVSADRRDNLDHLQRSFRNTKRSSPQGLWDVFPRTRTVAEMMDTMEKMMDDDDTSTTNVGRNDVYSGGRRPWDIKEGREDYKIRFDMPGMTKEDVKVWVEEKMLVLRAQKAPKKTQDQAVEDVNEEWPARSYGRYSCRIALPQNIEFEKIKAEVKDGVLYITIPKATPMTKVVDINVH